MRRLIVTNILSLDGYVAGPGGDVMAMPMDHAFDQSNAEHLRAADTLLLGATTYRGFLGFWPHALDMPGLTAPSREIATRYAGGIEIVVVSDSLTPDETGPWREQTRIVRRADARATVGELRQSPGGDVLVFGSPTLWNDLLVARLVDELHLMVGPAVVGGGTPAFRAGLAATRLELIGVRRWEDSSNVQLAYALSELSPS
jgi:dihydrofolate reductase